MKRNFFYFAWREFLRSASKNKNMATKGVLIFFAIYFSLVAFFMGFQLTENLKDLENPVQAFNAMLLIYFGYELVLRIMIQNLPTFGFQPFLLLPVKRKRIARYMLNKSLLHFFNVLPLILGLPFVIRIAAPTLAPPVFWAWLAALFLMIFVNHFLALYIKWRTNESDILFYSFLGLAAGLTAIDYFNIVDLTGGFGKLFDFIVAIPYAALIFPLAIVALYFLNQSYINSRFYLDELSKKKKQGATHDFSWLNNIGDYGKMLSLEVKMIMRNKRPKNTAMMSVLFLFYGLLIYKTDGAEEVPEFILVLGGMFMTGVFSMMYGQFFPAWHGKYYPLLMAQNVRMKQVIQSAFFLMAVTNVVYYLLSLGYMYITPKVLYIHLVVMLYNVGVNSWVIFALGLNSKKAIELNQRAAFNYQGVGATQWLMSFPVIFGPVALYGLLSWAFGSITAYVVFGSLGLIGIILHPRLIDYFTRQYLKRKHKMIYNYKST
ncbi:DUF5687 family protein [Draconibacterium sediminis]|uniref:Uncharacterized protein n=1 Tax=Draconibacterium sediminis TaxID=1544798 RepID=A0A0D8J4I6_9BACT|nr:DUF5687 family protein [Draconibacterium sediminis]KJF41865.1 hypothetical protein LH29_23315 [Draconibacterium sediminis]